jgi:hypothetical protein
MIQKQSEIVWEFLILDHHTPTAPKYRLERGVIEMLNTMSPTMEIASFISLSMFLQTIQESKHSVTNGFVQD